MASVVNSRICNYPAFMMATSYSILLARMIKNKFFKQGIGIAEKSQETRRDRWGGNVNHKCLF